MALKYWAYIFVSPGFEKTEQLMESKDCRVKLVGIDIKHKERAIDVAKELIKDGVQVIELCGAFGPMWITKISEAIDNKIPIGGVFYGPESRKPMLEILS